MLLVAILMFVLRGEEVMLAFWIITNICLYVSQTLYMLFRDCLIRRGNKKEEEKNKLREQEQKELEDKK